MSKHEPLPLCPNGADGTWNLSNIQSGRVCTLCLGDMGIETQARANVITRPLGRNSKQGDATSLREQH